LLVPVTIDVEGPAQAAFEELSGPGTLTLGASGYSLDLGAVAVGAAPISVSLGVLNAAAPGSDALSGSFSLSGPSAFAATGFGAFTGVAAGQADAGLSLVFTPGPAGPSTETVTLDPTSVGGSALAPVTLTVTADVMPCFHAGTRIATPDGAVAVETLRVGDLVSTASGGARPIVWVGSRRVDCTRHPRPELVHPVRITAGAFGPRLPKRDLILSPDHAVFAEGVLIPIKRLVNGGSVSVDPRASVEYFHIELDRHDMVLAEGRRRATSTPATATASQAGPAWRCIRTFRPASGRRTAALRCGSWGPRSTACARRWSGARRGRGRRRPRAADRGHVVRGSASAAQENPGRHVPGVPDPASRSRPAAVPRRSPAACEASPIVTPAAASAA
jgi:hypothetical protein